MTLFDAQPLVHQLEDMYQATIRPFIARLSTLVCLDISWKGKLKLNVHDLGYGRFIHQHADILNVERSKILNLELFSMSIEQLT